MSKLIFPLQHFKIEKEWTAYGLQCVVSQPRQYQNRCGYVRLPIGHRYWGKGYDELDVSVHGGLTFAERAEDGAWWIGFDCAHYNDARVDPSARIEDITDEQTRRTIEIVRQFPMQAHFWSLEEVIAETEQLAQQLGVNVSTFPLSKTRELGE